MYTKRLALAVPLACENKVLARQVLTLICTGCLVAYFRLFIVATGCPFERRPQKRGDSARIQGETTAFVEDDTTVSSYLKIMYRILCKTEGSRPY